MQINNKNDMIRSIQQRLANEISENDKLKMILKYVNISIIFICFKQDNMKLICV